MVNYNTNIQSRGKEFFYYNQIIIPQSIFNVKIRLNVQLILKSLIRI